MNFQWAFLLPSESETNERESQRFTNVLTNESEIEEQTSEE